MQDTQKFKKLLLLQKLSVNSDATSAEKKVFLNLSRLILSNIYMFHPLILKGFLSLLRLYMKNNRFKNRGSNSARRGRGSNGNGYFQTINPSTNLDSNGPCGRIKGNAYQIMEKYLAAAKDAVSNDDLVLSEICLQHAEHYYRIYMTAMENEGARLRLPANTMIDTDISFLGTPVIPEDDSDLLSLSDDASSDEAPEPRINNDEEESAPAAAPKARRRVVRRKNNEEDDDSETVVKREPLYI